MIKYIIKNCPNYFKTISGNYYCDFDAGRCQDCTDCVMKQIVEKCKGKMDTEFNSGSMFAEEILQLLQIEVLDET